MNRVYIVEFLEKKSKRLVSLFTGLKYYHTGMIIDVKSYSNIVNSYYCDLSPRKNEPDYLMIPINKHEFIKREKGKANIFIIPKYFTNQMSFEMLDWWRERANKNYSYKKLLNMTNTKWLLRFSRWYYRMKGKPYKPIMDKKGDVCSIAVDMCCKEAGAYDLFPELSERVVPPGLFAKKLKENEVKAINLI